MKTSKKVSEQVNHAEK